MVTNEEMAQLNEMAKRYAASGYEQAALTAEEWSFVRNVGLKLIGEQPA